jgi:hypothetical protein
MNQNDIIQWTGLIISIIALLISLIALIYTVLTYLLKSGHKITCNYTTCSSRECDDTYISSLTLENLKDRATVIFDIYLKLGNNNYLQIESFENSPLILKPFEVYHKEYDPVLVYSEGVDTIQINKLLNDDKVKKFVLLSTTDGKYVVKTNTKRWDTINVFFKNYFRAIIRPQRLFHKDRAYGSNVKFLLILKYKNGNEEVVPLHDGDEKIRIFKNFTLTKESLSTKAKLEEYIRLQKNQNKIDFDEFEALSLSERINEVKSTYKQSLTAEAISYFKYHLTGRLFTIKQNRKLDKENKRRKL